MLFTKKKIANRLADQFRSHSIKKYYVALVEGYVEQQNGIIKKSLKKGYFGEGKKVQVDEGEESKNAVTHFSVLERYDQASLLRVEILTGRTHQIRVHMASIGHSIIGDKLYGQKNGIKMRRQALHAETLQFIHPFTQNKMVIKALIPKDMQRLIEKLRDMV